MKSRKRHTIQPLTCAVIGSGIAGIAAALRLRHLGHDVHVYESHAEPGGKMRQLQQGDYRFDLGPTILTLPHLIDELFELYGRNPRDYIQFEKLEQPFQYFFSDGTTIKSYADIDRFAQEIADNTDDSIEDVKAYLKHVAEKYEITKDVFIENSLHKPSNYLRLKTFLSFLRFYKIEAFRDLDSGNRRFFKDPRTIQIFNKCASYIGSNPFVAPATLNVIQHLEVNCGVYLPEHGMYSIVSALMKLSQEVSIKYQFNTYIDEIIINKKQATGIRIGDKIKNYDRIISNMDIEFTYNRLLPNINYKPRSLKQEKSSSVIVFYWGINRSFDEMAVHNMFFTEDERAENNAIFNDHSVYHDPTIYVGITSKVVPSDAPPHGENWFTLVNAPNDNGQSWDEMRKQTRSRVIEKISSRLGVNLADHIVSEDTIAPPQIQQYFLSARGAIYGNSANNRFAAFLRHPNFTSNIKHLYFTGGSVHPGAGVPMSLNSAKIVAKIFK